MNRGIEMVQDKEPTMKETLKKIAIKSVYGFQTILNISLGMRLGIFDYLYEKAKSTSNGGKIESFTLEELSEKLDYSLKYLDAWLHMGFACGIFEIDDSSERSAKTAPFIYDILIDRDNMFYFGSYIKFFSLQKQ